MFASNVSLVPVPNPCINSHFQPPIYEFGDFKLTKTFYQDNNTFSYFNGTIDFRLTDVANNYTLYCNWGYKSYESEARYWKHDNCVTAGGALPEDPRIVTLLNADKENLMKNNSLESPIKIAQFWYCDIVNGSYP